MSDLIPEGKSTDNAEKWIVRFHRNRPDKFKNLSPGYVIIVGDPITSEAQFADAL